MRVVANRIKKITGFNPAEVEIMNGQDVVIDFDPEVPVVEVTLESTWPNFMGGNEF